MNSVPLKKVLSIQSHVVYGYVGNRAAVFPLQYLGYDVSFINSVQLTNHTHYPSFCGQILNHEDLKILIQGLEKNGLVRFDYLITGYCKSASFVSEICNAVKVLRASKPSMRYICDPVLGDQGRFYCPVELVQLFRDTILPLADVITPNQFEIEALCGFKVSKEHDAVKAMDFCHSIGVPTVIISSAELSDDPGYLTAFASQKNGNNVDRFRIRFLALPCQFTGTGDLFTALVTAQLDAFPSSISTVLERAISICQAILKLTYEIGHSAAGVLPSSNDVVSDRGATEASSGSTAHATAESWAAMELRVIEGRKFLDGEGVTFLKADRMTITANGSAA